MKKHIFTSVMLFTLSHILYSQNKFTVIIKDSKKEALPGATIKIKGSAIGAVANENGLATISTVPNGKVDFVISFVGYHKQTLSINFPRSESSPVEIILESDEEELEEVIVTSTRISRNIENIPTRIETISFEEIDEKSNMRPTNVSMLLHESTGIQVQQTSYTSATQTIRIQGLDGKYTQLLKDGFPNYSGFSSGLSILDIPPLDLGQVEVIKGSASTLYGGGAISGMINFISKVPKEKREIRFMVNQTSALGTDLGSFISGRNEKIGFTFLGTYHFQKQYDVDEDHFTELPRQNEFTIFPKLFFYLNENTTIMIGNNYTSSNRLGGDVLLIRGENDSNHSYFEKNDSYRNNTYLSLNKNFDTNAQLAFKQSVNYFSRNLSKQNYKFSGSQFNSYTDLSLSKTFGNHTIVAGANAIIDNFSEGTGTEGLQRDQSQEIGSLYIQDNWDLTERLLLEGGLRLDHHFTYGNFLLPRMYVLYKFNTELSARLGGGLGYKAPTIFIEETESLFFESVLPLDKQLEAEKSLGLNMDLNYVHDFSEGITFSLNQLFFYTTINNPLVLKTNNSDYFLENETDPIQSMGFETNLRFIAEPFKFFAGYTFVDAKAKYKTSNQSVTLTPRHKLNLMLLLEEHKNYKLGLEGYFTDNQQLENE